MPRYDSEAQLAAIELAWTLQSGGTVTEEQAGILRGFTGWGGLAPAFAVAPTGRWLTAADRIDAALPAEAFEAARDQVDTSYFTPEAVAGAVFELLRGTGFTGGNVLEPTFMRKSDVSRDIERSSLKQLCLAAQTPLALPAT